MTLIRLSRRWGRSRGAGLFGRLGGGLGTRGGGARGRGGGGGGFDFFPCADDDALGFVISVAFRDGTAAHFVADFQILKGGCAAFFGEFRLRGDGEYANFLFLVLRGKCPGCGVNGEYFAVEGKRMGWQGAWGGVGGVGCRGGFLFRGGLGGE